MRVTGLLSVLLFGAAALADGLSRPVFTTSTVPTSTKSACTKKTTSLSTPSTPSSKVTSKTTSTASASAKPPSTCNPDNCARAVTGTVLGTATASAHKSDCSSFLACTAYPSTSTATVTAVVFPTTQTVTVFPSTVTQIVTYTTIANVATTILEVDTVAVVTSLDVETVTAIESVQTVTVLQRRDAALTTTAAPNSVVCPTSVPTYASACSGTARFSSACSCFGVSKTTTTMTTPTVTVTATSIGQTTVTVSAVQTITSSVAAMTTATAFTTIFTTAVDVEPSTVIVPETSFVTVVAPRPTGNAYCENGQPVNGLSASCTTVGCSPVNLRIEGNSGTIYEGTILSGPRNITTPSGGTHLCDGTNDGANPIPFANGISAIDAAGGLCGFGYDGTFSAQFDDFFIQTIGDTAQSGDDFWGILLNYEFTPAGGCETEVRPTDELLWAFNAFNVNYFLRVQPTQTPVVLAPGQSTTFTIQGTDGDGDSFVSIAGASFNGQTSDGNGVVPFTAPTTPGTYRYKATRSDSIRSNAVTVVVQG